MASSEEITASEVTLIAAFRYALGRKNVIVDGVVHDLSANADRLSLRVRRQMIQEISDKWRVNALGRQSDTTKWVNFMRQLQGIEAESQD